jgi:hypothetical protein
MSTLADLMAEACKEGRVCPQPMVWNRLWELLPERRRGGVGWEPPLPLILAAWWGASDGEKRNRFHSHLRWASEHGAIESVATLISNMEPDDWHTER